MLILTPGGKNVQISQNLYYLLHLSNYRPQWEYQKQHLCLEEMPQRMYYGLSMMQDRLVFSILLLPKNIWQILYMVFLPELQEFVKVFCNQ